MLSGLVAVALLGSQTRAAVYTEQELGAYLAGDFERTASEACFNLVDADWNYNTDLLNATKEAALVSCNVGPRRCFKHYVSFRSV